MRRRLGSVVMAVAITVGLLLSAPVASGNPTPGAVPDPGFGDAGLAKLPPESTFSADGAATGDGTLLVSGGSSVQVLNSGGATGEAFGGAGSLTLPPATGDEFALGGFAIDPQGRLVVVGTSLLPESENPSPRKENGARTFRPSAVRILRFLPDGRLDASFGQGGVVETDLGLPAPLGTDGRRLGSHASVEATDVAVDPQGGIVVTGGAVVRLGGACHHDIFAPVAVSAGFVARFGEDGTPEPGFGRQGVVGGRSLKENPPGAEAIGEPVVSPRGVITYRSTGIDPCARGRSHPGIAQLTQDGRTRRGFGKKGLIVGSFRALVEGPAGSVIALGRLADHHGSPPVARLIRIGADGRRNGSFGTNGQTELRPAPVRGTALDSLAVDGQGRILVDGTAETGAGSAITLLRVSDDGRWEMNFGPHGRVVTRVPHLGQARLGDLFFDPQGRLISVHLYNEPLNSRSGLIVARYLLRN